MTLVRQYSLTARYSQEGALSAALAELATKVRSQHGCEGVSIYVDTGSREKFLFVEQWASRQDQETGGKALGRDAFAPIMTLVAEPPRSVDLEPVSR